MSDQPNEHSEAAVRFSVPPHGTDEGRNVGRRSRGEKSGAGRSLGTTILALSTLSILPYAAPQASASETIFENARKYTVRIKTSIRHAFAEDRTGTFYGAGFLVDRARGLIVTNAHVSGKSPASIGVAFSGSEFTLARPVYIDPELDLAILEIAPQRLPFCSITAELECFPRRLAGRQVATFGHPRGLSFSATTGIVSRVGFTLGNESVQTDAPINPGNSGGPLIDLKFGRVIGVNQSILKKSRGIGFAVPSKHLCKILSLVRQRKNPSPPDLGLEFAVHRDRGIHLHIFGGRNPNVL